MMWRFDRHERDPASAQTWMLQPCRLQRVMQTFGAAVYAHLQRMSLAFFHRTTARAYVASAHRKRQSAASTAS